MRNNKSNLYWQLELFELLQLLHQVVVVGTTGEKSNKADAVKPDIKQLSSESVLWIGDTEVDIKAALLLGVKACAVGCGLRTPDYLSTLNPNYLVSYLKEINLSEMSLL
jgi:phosphoglycolate phosphatase-like HAD superfamily hydrolase